MKETPKCSDCKHQDDDLARIPGLNGCKKRLSVKYDALGIKHPNTWVCFEAEDAMP